MTTSKSRLAFLVLALLGARSVLGAPLPTIDPSKAVVRPGPIDRGDDSDAARLIGIKAPALPELRWLDGQPRTLESLRGKVVVIRSFTNECPFCASTVPTLERLHEHYADRGVVVLGVYHPKPPAPVASGDVAVFARSLGVTFPVAVDENWSLVKSWWQAYSEGPWTSITWVLDRDGNIQYVHPGGEYHDDAGGPAHAKCRSDLAQLTHTIDRLLIER
jgi:peroxiredoxin